VIGVFHEDLVGIVARVLQQLGSHHVMVVNGEDGLDEITIAGKTWVGELKHGEVSEYTIRPEDFGMKVSAIESIQVENSEQSRVLLQSVLDNQPGPALDIVLLNAGAAIYVSGVTDSLQEGVVSARAAVKSGAAKEKLRQLVEMTHQSEQ
jgi:anthranilate phosphoribosyltransferase